MSIFNINNITIGGHLGKDPEIHTLEGGVKVASFSVATTRSYKKKGAEEFTDETTWHQVQAWQGLAETVEKNLKKGDKVCITGYLKGREWTDKNGSTHYRNELVAEHLMPMSGNSQSKSPKLTAEDNPKGKNLKADKTQELPV